MQNAKLILIVHLEESFLVYFERLICRKNKFMFKCRNIYMLSYQILYTE